EYLGAGDGAIVQVRRTLMTAVREFMEGKEPAVTKHTEIDYSTTKPVSVLVASDAEWRSVLCSRPLTPRTNRQRKQHMKRLHLATMAYALAAISTAAAAAQPADAPVRGGTLVFGSHLSEPSSYDCHATASNGPIVRLAPHYSTLLKFETERYPEV